MDEQYDISEPEPLAAEIAAVMGVAHHVYCSDTGCFDGSDIGSPELEAALADLVERAKLVGAADALRRVPCPRHEDPADSHRCPPHLCDRCRELTEAEARLREPPWTPSVKGAEQREGGRA